MMKSRRGKTVLTTAAAALLVLSAGAAVVPIVIPIDNPGFEDPVLVDDDWNYSMDNHGWGYFDNGG